MYKKDVIWCTYLDGPDFFCQFVNHIVSCLGLSTYAQLVMYGEKE